MLFRFSLTKLFLGLFIFREREGSLGGLSQLSAMKNLEKMFSNDWLDKNTNEEDIEDGDSLVDNALDNVRERKIKLSRKY